MDTLDALQQVRNRVMHETQPLGKAADVLLDTILIIDDVMLHEMMERDEIKKRSEK